MLTTTARMERARNFHRGKTIKAACFHFQLHCAECKEPDLQHILRFIQWGNYNFCPPANIRYGLVVWIHNSGHFGPPLPFWAHGPPPGTAGAADG